jgi:hypothetical protein
MASGRPPGSGRGSAKSVAVVKRPPRLRRVARSLRSTRSCRWSLRWGLHLVRWCGGLRPLRGPGAQRPNPSAIPHRHFYTAVDGSGFNKTQRASDQSDKAPTPDQRALASTFATLPAPAGFGWGLLTQPSGLVLIKKRGSATFAGDLGFGWGLPTQPSVLALITWCGPPPGSAGVAKVVLPGWVPTQASLVQPSPLRGRPSSQHPPRRTSGLRHSGTRRTFVRGLEGCASVAAPEASQGLARCAGYGASRLANLCPGAVGPRQKPKSPLS